MTHNEFRKEARRFLNEVLGTLDEKMEQYTNKDDALATYEMGYDFGSCPKKTLLLRIAEKVERLRTQTIKEQPLSQDALEDIVGHVIFLEIFNNEVN